MFNFAKKNKNISGEKISFDVDIPKSAVVAICGEPSKNMPVSPIKHTTKFLKKEDNIITLAIWSKKNYMPEYGENDTVYIVYNNFIYSSEHSFSKVFRFSAKILKITAATEINNFVSGTINGVDCIGYDLYITELEVVPNLKERPLREFYMTDISFSVCFKVDSFNEAGDNVQDSHKGYVKLDTVNMNSDGFSFKTTKYIEQEKMLKCMILTRYEALPVTVKILESKQVENKYKGGKDIYIARAMFVEADDVVIDMLAKRVLEYRHKMAVLCDNLIKLKNFYDKLKKNKNN